MLALFALICNCRITSVLVARLVLNLKLAAGKGHIADMHYSSHLEDLTALEYRVMGIAANEPEDLDSQISQTLHDNFQTG